MPATLASQRRNTSVRNVASNYTALLAEVREAGLLGRARGFYIKLFSVLCLILGGLVAGFVLLGDSWYQLLIAGALGLLLTQFAFIAHEASHRQVFARGRSNDVAGKILASAFVGISYSWWMNKHTRHHANPNKVGKDPDIEQDTISFLPEQAAGRRGPLAWLTRRQGYLFFPLLTLEGINLHAKSLWFMFSGGRGRDGLAKEKVSELTTVLLRLGLYIAVLFLVLSPGIAASFLGVQLAVFGVCMGASFAPNHKGMPVIPAGSTLDFFSRQVLTSRNITGRTAWSSRAVSFWMGGLNYQVEHHLFPSMPRPSLAAASAIVRRHCAEHRVPYVDVSLPAAYRAVIVYLNEVGLAAKDPFTCPMVSGFRRR